MDCGVDELFDGGQGSGMAAKVGERCFEPVFRGMFMTAVEGKKRPRRRKLEENNNNKKPTTTEKSEARRRKRLSRV